ncbi:MAG: ATP-binding protein, partial [Bacteroidales bacterium]|nr:ATP-binding protein [Bacteroidales bacterium]
MLLGREIEQGKLLQLLEKEESQFCVVYGRRRVGKTYLIRETFAGRFTFQHTGLANAPKSDQLREFKESLRAAGMRVTKAPKTWYEAFGMLQEHLAQLPS